MLLYIPHSSKDLKIPVRCGEIVDQSDSGVFSQIYSEMTIEFRKLTQNFLIVPGRSNGSPAHSWLRHQVEGRFSSLWKQERDSPTDAR